MPRILIIDDDPDNRELLKARLESFGFSVSQSADGEEGLAAARSAPPDLVVLDVMMPRLDGWQVCRELKGHPGTRHVPVIMLTARGRQIEELRGWESGADAYLVKPWDPAQLLETIRRLAPAVLEGGAAP